LTKHAGSIDAYEKKAPKIGKVIMGTVATSTISKINETQKSFEEQRLH